MGQRRDANGLRIPVNVLQRCSYGLKAIAAIDQGQVMSFFIRLAFIEPDIKGKFADINDTCR